MVQATSSASPSPPQPDTKDANPHPPTTTTTTTTTPRSRSNTLQEGKYNSQDDAADDDRDDRTSLATSSEDFELDDMWSDEGLDDDEETGLTRSERRRRRRRKRRNTLLENRIAGSIRISKEEEEKKIADRSFARAAMINALLIASWYFFSISISIYNKWMFSDEKNDETDGEEKPPPVFPFPLFSTCLHMVVQFSLASLVLYLFPRFRPRQDSLDPHHTHLQRSAPPPRDGTPESKKPLMTRWFYLTRIGPCGTATGMDIGLGNMSLKFISLTFYTMCKSSVLGFVLLFAFIFRLEKPSWRLGGIITIMTAGVIMMVAGETSFHLLGFVLVMSAAASSGFRWSLTQILLLRHPATSNPFASIFFLAPIMFLSLLVIAIPVEGLGNIFEGFGRLQEAKGSVAGFLILLFPGCLAFCMTASEFGLLQRTSVVTLSVAGIFKEIVTISAASLVFHDQLTPINISGLFVTIGSIAAYNYIKVKKMREEAREQVHMQINEDYTPVGSEDPDSGYEARPTPSKAQESSRVGSLIRDTLQISAPAGPSGKMSGDSARASPIKRPEDHD